MSDTPDQESAPLNGPDAEEEHNPPTQSQVMEAIVYWLRHWWDSPREKSKAADWVMVALTVLIALAAFWSARIFQRQLTEARNATELSRETLISTQRAYVSVTGLEIRPKLDDNQQKLWAISPVFENTGNTPTKNLRWAGTMRDWDPYLPLSKVKRGHPSAAEDITQVTLNRLSLGPHQVVRDRFEASEPIPNGFIEAIRRREMNVYIHGIVVYDDFVSPKHHVLRYCYVLWNAPVVVNSIGFTYSQCGDGRNCTDEECDDATLRQLGQRLSADAAEKLRQRPN